MKNRYTLSKAAMLMAAATTGMAATSQAALTYNETISGDLSNNSGVSTMLASGTDEIIGGLNTSTDPSDYFIVSSLDPGGTATFSFSFNKVSTAFGVNFTFRDADSLVVLFSTGANNAMSGGGTTLPLAVTSSGQIRISVENIGTSEGFEDPSTSWSVSTLDVVPEPAGAALLALGSLLALRRQRN